MTNREQLAFAMDFYDYTDEEVADIISDALMSITDEDDISVAVICGNDKRLLAEWLGKEVEECPPARNQTAVASPLNADR